MQDIPIIYKGIYMAIMGAIVGSFLNVCIYRIPRGISIIFPPSHCPNCRYKIPYYYNIPIIGWFVIKGKCKNCNSKISILYPLIEALSAGNFFILYMKYRMSIDFIFLIIFTSMCLVLSFVDLKHFILPDVITIPMTILGLLYSLLIHKLKMSILGGIAGALILITLYFVYYLVKHQEGLGFGDVKMIAGIGTFLGLKLMLLTLFIAVISGTLVGIIIVIKKKYFKFDIPLPFGTFLGFASLISLFYGNNIIFYYFYYSEKIMLKFLNCFI